jgi:hypothetical protein
MIWLVAADRLPEALETARPRAVAAVVAGAAISLALFMLVLL